MYSSIISPLIVRTASSLVALSALACSDDESSISVSGTVGVDGGTISGTVESGQVGVDIPAGALVEDTELSIQTVSVDAPTPAGKELASATYAFLPHGTEFASTATLIIPHDGSASGAVRLDDENDTTWSELSDISIKASTIEVKVDGFSIYAAVANTTSSGCAGGVEVTGQVVIDASRPPASSTLDGHQAIVVWLWDDDGSDKSYKFGAGQVSGGDFNICIPGELPSKLGASTGLSFGFIGLLPPSATLPADGVIDDSTLNQLSAFGNGTILSYKHSNYDPMSLPANFWANDFPSGLSCGTCKAGSMGFDSLTKVNCAGAPLVFIDPSNGPECNLF